MPEEDVRKRDAVRCFVGALILAALQLPFARHPAVAMVAGGIIAAVGVGWILGAGRGERKAGIFVVAVGVMQALSRFPVPHIALVFGTLRGMVMFWLIITGARLLVSRFIGGRRFR